MIFGISSQQSYKSDRKKNCYMINSIKQVKTFRNSLFGNTFKLGRGNDDAYSIFNIETKTMITLTKRGLSNVS